MATAGASRGPGPERAFLDAIPASGVVRLTAEEGHHLVRARRARRGDDVVLFDGRGTTVLARLLDETASAPSLALVGPYPAREPLRAVHVACAIPGPSRLDDLVSSLAEVGAASLVPLRCARSDPSSLAVLERRRERLDRLLREAAKVSGRSRLLRLEPAADLETLLAAAGDRGARGAVTVLLDPDPSAPPLRTLLASLDAAAPVLLVVGPEGGFTEREIARAAERAVPRAMVSPCALRTEVAALAGVVIALAG